MTIKEVDACNLAGFIAYCKLHRHEVDESFLYDEHLDGFVPGRENPAVVALGESGIVGAGALIVSGHMRRGSRARFRIFHCETGDVGCYAGMLAALMPHTTGLNHLFIYAPEQNTSLRAALAQLGFAVERYSFYLVRGGKTIPQPAFPDGFAVRAYRRGEDAAAWCTVRNAAFATLKGSETPITGEMAEASAAEALPGGALLLCRGAEPVGIVKVGEDDFEGETVAEIGPLALLPDWQGRGLGRQLLRAALCLAQESGYGRAALCVNAENERAASLYLQEGFEKAETVICFRYDLMQD